MDNNNKALSHFGIPGMHWGQRKGGNAVSISRKSIDPKRAAKTAGEQIKNRLKETTKYKSNSTFHPILTSRATRESLKGNSVGTVARRSLFYQKTSEVKDINKRVSTMLAKNQKIKDIKTQYKKEYMDGQSAVGKIFAKITTGDKIYANTMYDLNKK